MEIQWNFRNFSMFNCCFLLNVVFIQKKQRFKIPSSHWYLHVLLQDLQCDARGETKKKREIVCKNYIMQYVLFEIKQNVF